MILYLTRDLGVNLAGVEIILNMREKMGEMQHEFESASFQYLAVARRRNHKYQSRRPEGTSESLVPISPHYRPPRRRTVSRS